MKISELVIFPISVDRKRPILLGSGVLNKTIDSIFVKLTTEEEITGIGELRRMDLGTVDDILTRIRPELIGQSVMQRKIIVDKVYTLMEKAGKPETGSYIASAIDMALFDLMAKKSGMLVAEMLGGVRRRKVPLTWVIGIKDLEETLREALEARDNGFQTLKLKVGLEFTADVEKIKQMRNAVGPGVKIRVDANGAWSPDVAIRFIREIEKFELELVEQPVAGWDINGLAKVAHAVDIPILADESLRNCHDAITIIEKKAADVLNVSIARAGGLENAKDIFSIGQAANVPCLIGSNLELGIGTSAGVHLAAAVKNLPYANDLIGPLYSKVQVTNIPLGYERGFLSLPERPGLGVELDEEKIEPFLRSDLLGKVEH